MLVLAQLRGIMLFALLLLLLLIVKPEHVTLFIVSVPNSRVPSTTKVGMLCIFLQVFA